MDSRLLSCWLLSLTASYDRQNRHGSSRAPVILMLSWYEEIQTGVERERLERLVGGGPPHAPVILIKTLLDRHKGRAWRGWREAVRPLP